MEGTSGSLSFFRKVGDDVLRAWAKQDFDEAALPNCAVQCLEAARTHEHVDVVSLLEEVQVEGALPAQHYIPGRAPFGQPPLTVYSHSRFYAEVLFWLDGTTDVHQHGFSGAFQVLAGGSIATRFSFDSDHRISSHLRLGRLKALEREYLRVGDVRPIRSGAALIHSVFHLDRPSVTLVVRTASDSDASPQWSFRPPHVSYVPAYLNEELNRRIEALKVLFQVKPRRFWTLVPKLLADSPFDVTAEVLQVCFDLAGGAAGIAPFVKHAQTRHGEKVDLWIKSVEKRARDLKLLKLRSSVTDADGRLLLALLLNADCKDDVWKVCRARDPEHPPAQFLAKGLLRMDATSHGQLWAEGTPALDDGCVPALTKVFEGSASATEPWLGHLRRSPALEALLR